MFESIGVVLLYVIVFVAGWMLGVHIHQATRRRNLTSEPPGIAVPPTAQLSTRPIPPSNIVYREGGKPRRLCPICSGPLDGGIFCSNECVEVWMRGDVHPGTDTGRKS
jgi:hypothetical protein